MHTDAAKALYAMCHPSSCEPTTETDGCAPITFHPLRVQLSFGTKHLILRPLEAVVWQKVARSTGASKR